MMHAWLQGHVRLMFDTLPDSTRRYAWLYVAEAGFGPVELAEGDIARVAGLVRRLVALSARPPASSGLRGVLHLRFSAGRAPGEVRVRTTGMGLPATDATLDEREADALARTIHELASMLAVRDATQRRHLDAN